MTSYHNPFGLFEGADVGKRIFGDGDYIGRIAYRNPADFILHTQGFGGDGGGAGERFGRGHSGFDQQCELAAIGAVLEYPGVRSESDSDAHRFGARYLTPGGFKSLPRLDLYRRRVNALALPRPHALKRHQRGHESGAFRLHYLERRFIGEGAMFDAVDTGSRRSINAPRAVRMGNDLQAQRMRCVRNRDHFLIGEMRFKTAPLLRQHAAGCGYLDDIGTKTRTASFARICM